MASSPPSGQMRTQAPSAIAPIALALLSLTLLTLSPLTAALAAAPTLAITYFDNNTQDSAFDPLGRGLADMLITDLNGLEGLQVVERSRLNELLAELKLADSGFIDPKTAATMGKGLGARFVLTGSFAAVQPDMRIDARIVEVQSGKVIDSRQVTGPVD